MKINLLKRLYKRMKQYLIVIILIGCLITGIYVPLKAYDGIQPEDPMVKITTLPIDKNIDEILTNVSNEVSQSTGIEKQYITYYWQTFDKINCMGEKTTEHPVFVDLYVPGFFNNEQIASLMTNLAESLAKHTGIEKKWVFIHTHFPRQGQVYMSEKVQRWDNYAENDNSKIKDVE
ncbi:MAG: hypothetical protein AB1782_12120 [Cyanobacteriota bacterium]